MSKINRESTLDEALHLLDDVGLDKFSTRQLAARLDVEQPALYWHFSNKDELLAAMAERAMAPHRNLPLPGPADQWRPWFMKNYRSFRQTLLLHRDGARLHAGSLPRGNDAKAILSKIDFLTRHGIPRAQAHSAMITASHLTIGNALETQAAAFMRATNPHTHDYNKTFEAGLTLLITGLGTNQDESKT